MAWVWAARLAYLLSIEIDIDLRAARAGIRALGRCFFVVEQGQATECLRYQTNPTSAIIESFGQSF